MTGASSDPYSGYGWDGDEHWTPALVRQWWRERAGRQPLVDRLVAEIDADPALHGQGGSDEPLIRGAVASYLAYLDAGMAADLRRYLFFLESGDYPSDDDELPTLD